MKRNPDSLFLPLQSVWRGLVARRQMGELKRVHATLVIQTAWRGYVARRGYHSYVKDITAVQNRWRGRQAKRELRRLRQEARESSKLLKDKRTLELRVQELEEIVNTVQTQRNELKQSLKDEKAQITAASRRTSRPSTADRDSISSEMQSEAAMATERESSLKVSSS